jgi:hypothetical protein
MSATAAECASRGTRFDIEITMTKHEKVSKVL